MRILLGIPGWEFLILLESALFRAKRVAFAASGRLKVPKNAQVPIPLKKSELPAPQKLVYFAATNTLRSTGPVEFDAQKFIVLSKSFSHGNQSMIA